MLYMRIYNYVTKNINKNPIVTNILTELLYIQRISNHDLQRYIDLLNYSGVLRNVENQGRGPNYFTEKML